MLLPQYRSEIPDSLTFLMSSFYFIHLNNFVAIYKNDI